MEVINSKHIKEMIPVLKERFPYMNNTSLYKDLELASKQFAKDFKFGVV